MWCLYLYYIKSKLIADSLIIFLSKEIKALPYYIVSNCCKGSVLQRLVDDKSEMVKWLTL